jgi:flagellar hook-associated protein 1 FlgK
MSLLGLFDIGKSAILSNQVAMNAISNNIANVNTEGYSRQEVVLETTPGVQVRGDYLGRGVQIAGMRRHYDKFIQLQIIGQNQSYGRSYSLDQGLSHVEQIFNEAKGLGLSNSLQDYFNAWQGVATDPEGQPQRITLLQKAKALIQNAQQIERDVSDTLKNVNDEIANVVDRVNTITSQISKLNEKIVQVEAGKSVNQASYLRDQRDKLLNDLAGQIDYTWFEGKNGDVTVMVGGKSLVTPEKAYQLSTSVDIEGNRSVIFGRDDLTSLFEKGQLAGNIAVRDELSTDTLTSLRKLIGSIIKETNSLHSSGYGLDSSTGNDFFDPLQIYTLDYSSGGYISSATVTDPSALTLDEYDLKFTDASNYEIYNKRTGALATSGAYTAGNPIDFEGIRVVVDGSPAADDSFLISPLRGVIENFNVAITDTQKIAASSSNLTLPGDNTNALQLFQLSQSGVSDLSGATFNSFYGGIVSNVGINSKAASDGLTYDDNLLTELKNKREELSGVSLDEEAANLIKYQRAYEAGARILQITDSLLTTIINSINPTA